ncbi:hypothetical protein E2C01_016084 [Portunus trituberculatus]|uniref:Uncharacterized protein n=1 Tax=Portunus trituberculatus TaxID=210409 RepID=A0A5B7DNM1_PORTR|nr:hypothetical protein [Portunus trituberculatus]
MDSVNRLLQQKVCTNLRKSWINVYMDTDHYEPSSNPVKYNYVNTHIEPCP